MINLFVGEFKGADFRKHMGVQATRPQYQGKVKELILYGIEYYRALNPEALETKNGVKVVRPTSHYKPVAEQIVEQKDDIINL